MDYTKDRIFSIKYKNNKPKIVSKKTQNIGYRIAKWIKRDEYFTVVVLTSIVVLAIDFFVVKRFIDLINLL